MTKNVQLLFAYLVLERNHVHSRETLTGLFWGDHRQDRARSCLNTTLWRLRSALESTLHSDVPFLLNYTSGEICFNSQSNYWLDVETFEQSLERLRKAHSKDPVSVQLKIAEQAEQLYIGELLEGYYDNWVINERERLRSLYLWVLAYLMSANHQEGQLDQSLYYGQKVLQLEPLREEIYREMMLIYAKAGYRSQALAVYETCRQALQNELNIAPMPETQKLYHQILNGPPHQQKESPLTSVEYLTLQEKSNNLVERIKAVMREAADQINNPNRELRPEQYELLQKAVVKLDQAADLAKTTNRQILGAIAYIEDLINRE